MKRHVYNWRLFYWDLPTHASQQKHRQTLIGLPNRGFHMHKIANIAIIVNFVLRYICSFLLYLQHMVLVNMKIDISGFNSITFQGCRLRWSSYFLMVKVKQSWQYWHSCIVESLWKTLMTGRNIPITYTSVRGTILLDRMEGINWLKLHLLYSKDKTYICF